METITALFLALFQIFPHATQSVCMHNRQQEIVHAAAQVEREFGVPPAVILSVGFLESHLGCDRASGGCWGAPISPTRRTTAGTHMHAGRALATSYRVCTVNGQGSWLRAISRFRCGRCGGCPDPRNPYTAAYTIRVVERLHEATNLPAPANLRSSNR